LSFQELGDLRVREGGVVHVLLARETLEHGLSQ
jgi:hypothetical protein